MARAALENALPPSAIDALFENVAERQDSRALLFSDVVGPMAMVVCKLRPSINATSTTYAETLGVPRQTVSNPINGVEPAVGAALVRHTAAAIAPVVAAMGGRREPWLSGDRVRVLDGRHWPGTEHRIKPRRTERAGALPGQVLGVFDPESMRVVDALPGEDGHAQERSRTDQVLAVVGPGELGVAERNVGTTAWLFGIVVLGRRSGYQPLWEAEPFRPGAARSASGVGPLGEGLRTALTGAGDPLRDGADTPPRVWATLVAERPGRARMRAW